jgi:hypothetical protein
LWKDVGGFIGVSPYSPIKIIFIYETAFIFSIKRLIEMSSIPFKARRHQPNREKRLSGV